MSIRNKAFELKSFSKTSRGIGLRKLFRLECKRNNQSYGAERYVLRLTYVKVTIRLNVYLSMK